MNLRVLPSLVALAAIPALAPSPTLAQNPASPTASTAPSPDAELRALVTRIQTKLQAGQTSAAALAPELAGFDALLEKYQDQKTDAVAQILLMKATLYLQVFNDMTKGSEILRQLKAGFPGTQSAAMVDRVLLEIAAAADAEAARTALVGQPAPELHFNWASRDDLKTLGALKGKIVVLDFWATWCGPCIASFPQMRELAAHYKNSPVEIVGVTSLQGRVHGLEAQPIDTRADPAREHALMSDFIKAKDVTWTIAFSAEEVFNPDYGVTGIPHLAIIAPDGTVRHTGLHPAMPSEEKYQLIDALLNEFALPVPLAEKS